MRGLRGILPPRGDGHHHAEVLENTQGAVQQSADEISLLDDKVQALTEQVQQMFDTQSVVQEVVINIVEANCSSLLKVQSAVSEIHKILIGEDAADGEGEHDAAMDQVQDTCMAEVQSAVQEAVETNRTALLEIKCAVAENHKMLNRKT